jgi:hypothetical protein
MSLPEDNPKQHALKREWAAARIVVIGGFIVAIAVAGYFAYRQEQAMRAQSQATAQAGLPHKIDAKLLARAELAVCSAELIQAQSIGIVPTYGQLVTPRLVRENTPRRFICEAGTHLTRYFIAADIVCNNLADARCVSVFRIALKNGTLVYQRPE